MIKILREVGNNIEVASDSGKLVDIGGGAVKSLIITKAELEYVEEVEPQKE